MNTFSVNYFAIFVSAVIAFMMGAAWYSKALFFRPWAASIGKSEEELKKVSAPYAYVVAFLSWFVAIYVLARVFWLVGVNDVISGLRVTSLVWLGFSAATSLIHISFEGRSFLLWLINWSYILAGLLVGAIIITVW